MYGTTMVVEAWPPVSRTLTTDTAAPMEQMECSNQLENMMINMIIKIVIFDIFTQVPGQTAILAGFAAFFYADSCRRYVKSSFLSPFQDHFCFPQKSLSTSTSMFFCFLIVEKRSCLL